VRARALQIIARVQGADALPLLVAAAAPGQPLRLRGASMRSLSGYHDPRAVAALEAFTAPTEPRDLRTAGLSALAATDSTRGAAAAGRGVDDADPLYAIAAVQTLARIGGAAGRARLAAAATTETRPTVRAAITAALGH
jgi:hypothetical protein